MTVPVHIAVAPFAPRHKILTVIQAIIVIFKFAQNYEKIWIQLFQQLAGIYSKSNMKTCHKK